MQKTHENHLIWTWQYIRGAKTKINKKITHSIHSIELALYTRECLQKKKISRKPVPIVEIDISGNVINTYSSIRSASKVLNIDPHSIRDNLSHKFKTANGHMFRYLSRD